MPFNPEGLAARRQRVNASEVAAIMGLSPWRSMTDVFAEKIGVVEDGNETSPWLAAGSRYEPAVLDFVEARIGPLDRTQRARPVPDLPILWATPDAIHIETGLPCEAKTSGLGHPVRGQWGDDGTDHVPEAYLVQTMCQMMATGAARAYLGALIGGIGERLYIIDFDEIVADAIRESVIEFWKHVETKVWPSHPPLSPEVAKRVRREPRTLASGVDRALVDGWLKAREARLAAEHEEDRYARMLITRLETAEGARFEDGLLTYLETTRHLKPQEARIVRFRQLQWKGEKNVRQPGDRASGDRSRNRAAPHGE